MIYFYPSSKPFLHILQYSLRRPCVITFDKSELFICDILYSSCTFVLLYATNRSILWYMYVGYNIKNDM